MAVSARKVQNKRDSNGVLTGKPGTVYDVNIKYNSPEGRKTYSKKGFTTKKEAAQHEAEMKTKLQNPTYTPVTGAGGKQTLKEYLEEWVENHGKANLHPCTFASYKGNIKIILCLISDTFSSNRYLRQCWIIFLSSCLIKGSLAVVFAMFSEF